VFVGCLLLRRGRGLRLHPNEALVASLVLATLLSFGVVAGLAAGGDQQLSQQIDKTFQSTAKRQSAQSRENQWAAAVDVVKEQPFLGHGLGVEFDHFEVGPNRIWRQDISHNIVLDVAMRAGLIGAAALLLALLVSLVSGVAVAVRGRPMTAALALAATAALTGLVTKGMVESIFEKHRLALLLGLVLGVLWRAQITNRQQAKVPESRNAELARLTSRTSPT
jgi:O-antigen ligase